MNSTFNTSRHVLAVQDFAISLPFYEKIMGCSIEVFDGGNWAFATRDQVTFMLGQCREEKPASAIGDHSYVVYIEVSEIESLFTHFQNMGANIRRNIRVESWGMKEFAVESPDGHRFMFGEKA